MKLAFAFVLTLALAPSARAAWSDPAGGIEAPTAQATGALAADGTPVVAWADGGGIHARVGAAAPVVLEPYEKDEEPPQALAGGQDIAVVWFAHQQAYAAAGTVSSGLGAPTPIGGGYPDRAVANGEGDMAVLTAGNGTTAESFRPAGGAFGPPLTTPAPASPRTRVYLPDVTPSLALSPTGEALVGWRTRTGADVASRAGDATAFTDPVSLGGPGGLSNAPPVLALDAHGRALAAWDGVTQDGGAYTYASAVANRDAAGVWHSVSAPPPVTGYSGAQVGTDDAGNGLIAWTAGFGPTAVAPISLESGSVGAETDYPVDVIAGGGPISIDAHGTWAVPTLAVASGGAATLTWGHDRDVLVARGDTAGAFGTPAVAGCELLFNTSPRPVGLDGAGHAGVLFNAYPDGELSVAHDGVDAPDRSCPPAEAGSQRKPTVSYGAAPVVAGRPVRVTATGVRQPNAKLVRNQWDVDGDHWRAPVVTAGDAVTLTFPNPGRLTWVLHSIQHYEGYAAEDDMGFDYRLDVYAPATLHVRATGRTLHLRATAFTYGPKVPVTLALPRHRVHTRAGLGPLHVSLPVTHAGRYRVRLLQGGVVRARASVRVR